MTALPTSIRIFLSDGSPDGIRIVSKSNWVGQAVVASRAQIGDALKRDELDRPGVYLLLGLGESGAERLYIGEADVLGERLKQHVSGKEFWTSFIAFSSADRSLNKASVRYLEARLVELARAANQWEMDNEKAPSKPSLSEADRADAEGFLAEMLVIYPVLGVDAFEAASTEAPSSESTDVLYLDESGAKGQGREVKDGFVVLEGSRARSKATPSVHSHIRDLRQQLKERGVMVPNENQLEFKQDYRFTSPSTAAGVLVGGNPGLASWKDSNGITLKQIQAARVEKES